MSSIGDKLKGKAKDLEGRLTGDKIRQAQGKAQKAKGDVEGALSRVKNRAKARIQEARAKHAVRRAAKR